MRAKIAPSLLAVVLIFQSHAVSAAQAVTIISNDGDAQKCSIAAHTTAQSGFASHEDLAACDRALDHAHLKKRDLAGTWVNRGIIATALSRYREAFGNYQRALKVMPGLPEAFIGRGNIYFMSGKLDMAIDDYTRALDLNLGREHVAFLNRGMAYEKLKRYEDAEENYRLALEAVPDWKLARQKLSLVRAKQTVGE